MSKLRSLARRRSVAMQRTLELHRRRHRLLWEGYRSRTHEDRHQRSTEEEHNSAPRARTVEH
jgi:hypothetical protein